ncbi:hypothetical protein PCASD_09003 [Puccinia coronata f. sp. avenae]|uniref:Mediator of RNA polymerase II transcription subunit 19 n=1 Tax=Puccinia coronata f. sp. avenae TaxID=200324 RepID=A0A2N5UKJ0_9BASI|nr:hypothetical protein PCASD_09003 [Puccinia coronata f. sp. avenae]
MQQLNPNHPPPQAGTSNRTNPKTLFFPVIDQGHLPAAPISGSHDLLSLFNVSSVYDLYVKPYLKPLDQPNKLGNSSSTLPTNTLLPNHHHPPYHIPSTNGDLKGKGKADSDLAALSPAQVDSLGQKRNKMEKSYGHFVADVGGRNSIKKDHQLESWISDASFQEANIPNFLKPFSDDVLSQAFTLQPGIQPNFDASVWVAEEGGPKKRRKKRKQGEMLAGSNPPQAAGYPQQHARPSNPATTSAPPSHYPAGSSVPSHPTRSARSAMDPSSHLNHHHQQQQHHLPAHLHLPQHQHQHPQQQQQQQQHASPSLFCREDDYRKKKRVKIGNPAAGKNSGSGSSGPSHQVALQS